ncbi:DUF1510 family protein [Bacillus sp. HMF5848]|uniref:YrrS family protein n=1 Tax=Bacillus sp. HMF5848 TaxID=2495421 RepID=UPI000F7777BC|nr:YrrS family protein [Bacillus sp. HMF5848]RSK27957.1 DUF1510 family protein [Bacillus sp. HMF5848]
MGHDFDDLYEGPRYQKQLKRRRVNRILNVLLSILLLLGLGLGVRFLFNSSSSEPASTLQQKQTESSPELNDENSERNNNNKTDTTTENNKEQNEDSSSQQSEVLVKEGEEGSNIIKTIIDSDWEAIGTQQAEPHVVNDNLESIDVQEMKQAVTYATGIDDFILWWLTNDGQPNSALLTISNREQTEVYDVHLVWIENKGWKPVAVDRLKENLTAPYISQQQNSSEQEQE